MGKKLDRPYAGGRWTKAKFFSFVRSALRRASVKWPPKADAMRAARRAYKGSNKRRKYEYLCAECGEWCAGKDVDVDHILPCGTLRALDDLPEFVRRLFVEQDGYQVLCSTCHAEKTRAERVREGVHETCGS